MLLQVIEAIIWKNRYKIQAQAAAYTPSQKTAHARKDGMLHGKIICSYLMGKAVNNYSQF